MKKGKIIILVIFIFTVLNFNVFSQCNNCVSQYPSSIQSTTNNSLITVSACMNGGDYAVFYVDNGQTYEWTTCGLTSINTQLTLQKGIGCSGVDIAYNDNACGNQSTITWTANFSGYVSILITEYNCASNSTCMTLKWLCVSCGSGIGCGGGPICSPVSPPANDNCQNATQIYDFEGYCGSTSASYTAYDIPADFCGSVENNSWLQFTATDPTFIIDVFVCNCNYNDGIQIEIYSTTDCAYFTSVSNCWNPGVLANGTVTANNLIPGESYYIMIDGYAAGVCDYTFSSNYNPCFFNVQINGHQDTLAKICKGQSLQFNATGGNHYTWSPSYGLSDTTINNPVAQPDTSTIYTCTIINDTYCPDTVQKIIYVNVSPQIALSTSHTDAGCYNDSAGVASVFVSSGTLPYEYEWNTVPVQNTPIISGLTAGEYYVTVTNQYNCATTDTVIIEQEDEIVLIQNIQYPTCNNNNGTIGFIVSSGSIPPLSYYWSDGSQEINTYIVSDSLNNVSAGIYTVTVVNSNSCSTIQSFNVYNTSDSSLQTEYIDTIQCYGICSASFAVTMTGSLNPPYSFIWSNGIVSDSVNEPTDTIYNLCAGNFFVIVSDSAGCEMYETFVISEPLPDSSSFSFSAIQGTVTLTNNSSPGMYYWDFDDSSFSSDTNTVHEFFSSGYYNVCLTVFTLCDSITSCQQIPVVIVGSPENVSESFKISPNPFSETTTVKFHNPGNSAFLLTLKDAGGRIVQRTNNITGNEIIIERKTLDAGVYFMELKGENRIYRGKIMVE